MFKTQQYSEVISLTWSQCPPSLFTLGRGRNCECNRTQRMYVLIAISHVLHTLAEEECQWFFQLNGNSCLGAMCLMEVERARCFYLLWPQLWKGNTSNGYALPSDARLSSQTFFGFLQQNMACYPGHWVSMGKTQFVWGTTGPAAGILQVSTFQLQGLRLVRKCKTIHLPLLENVFTGCWFFFTDGLTIFSFVSDTRLHFICHDLP